MGLVGLVMTVDDPRRHDAAGRDDECCDRDAALPPSPRIKDGARADGYRGTSVDRDKKRNEGERREQRAWVDEVREADQNAGGRRITSHRDAEARQQHRDRCLLGPSEIHLVDQEWTEVA